MKRPLKDVRVVDCTAYVAGPTCTMFLADMGAEVIKIEPSWGDAMRMMPPLVKGESNHFMFLNRNKKSMVINLKDKRGVKIFKDLAKNTDIVVENFRPGVMDKMGIGYEILKEVNPSIIFASISGYGQYGPYIKRPSFNIIAQALSGWMTVLPDSPTPIYSGEYLGDTVPALICTIGILSALHFRDLTGEGQRIDVAQMDSLISIMPSITLYLQSGLDLVTSRYKYPLEGIYGTYKTKDGYVTIRAIGKHLESLGEILGRNAFELLPSSPVLEEWTKEKEREEVVFILNEVDVPCAPVLSVGEVVNNANVKAREMIVQLEHPKGFSYSTTGFPIKFSKTPIKVDKPSPLLGQHTKEILSTVLSLNSEEIERLRKKGVVYFPK